MPRICVCVKVVPRAVVPLRLDPENGRLDRTGPTELNPADAYAVEEALQLRERAGGEVVLVSVGPHEGAESLRVALAMGADRAILVADPALAGSDLLGTSLALAAALVAESPDIVLFGSQSVDGGGALLWGAVAERLQLPLLSGVRSLDVEGGTVRASRQVLGGEQTLAGPMPCVVALAGSVNTPRYPAFREIVQAKRKEIHAVSLADLGVDEALVGVRGARTEVLAVSPAPARRSSGEVREDDGTGAAWLAAFITTRGLA